MSAQSILEKSNQLKELGNLAFKDGKANEAIRQYDEAIRLLESLHNTEDVTVAQNGQVQQLLVSCYLNSAMCYLKLERFVPTIAKADNALKIDPNNVKGLYRRGVARLSLRQFSSAKEDLEKALQLDPGNGDVKRQLKAVKEKVDKSKPSSAQTGSVPNKIPETAIKEIQELEEQYVKVARELQALDARLGSLDREKKRAEITRKELSSIPEKTKLYRSVGKMFLSSSVQETDGFLEESMSTCDRTAEGLKARKEYLERQQHSIQTNVKELVAQG